MKRLILTILFLISAFLSVKAQETIKTIKLIPYIEWLAIKEKEDRGICGFGEEILKPKKLNADFKVTNQNLLNDENIIAIEIQTNSKDLIYQDISGLGTAMMRYFVRIMSKDRKFDSVSEDILTIDEIPINIISKSPPKAFPVYYRRIFKLPKGKYTFNFFVDNRGLNEIKKKIKFEVSKKRNQY